MKIGGKFQGKSRKITKIAKESGERLRKFLVVTLNLEKVSRKSVEFQN